MKAFILLLILSAGFADPAGLEPADVSTLNYIWFMPEIVVTAPRYRFEDEAWSGMMPEIIVTAPRHVNEDEAWSGMMPEVLVTAERFSVDTDKSEFQAPLAKGYYAQSNSRQLSIYGVLALIAGVTIFSGIAVFIRFLH